jgi:hypothetical protein
VFRLCVSAAASPIGRFFMIYNGCGRRPLHITQGIAKVLLSVLSLSFLHA